MKILLNCILVLIFGLSPVKSKPLKEANYIATSYIVMNRHNFEVMEGGNVHVPRSVASISKVMTAILALESNRIFDVVSAPPEVLKQEGSSIYLKADDQLTILDLVYGLMLRSGNDAAYMIADYLGPTLDSFVLLMNKKAKEIGMIKSHFNNPSGLDVDDEGNISTAFDIATLFTYAMKNKLFSMIVSSKSYRSPTGSTWINKNKLLNSYDKCDGGKTGYTKKAKRTLVTGAKEGDSEYTIVTLNCGSDFSFHRSLYEKYFNKYTYVPFLKVGDNIIGGYKVKSDKDIGILVQKEHLNKKCIILYRFNEEGILCEMYFVYETGKRVLIR